MNRFLLIHIVINIILQNSLKNKGLRGINVIMVEIYTFLHYNNDK